MSLIAFGCVLLSLIIFLKFNKPVYQGVLCAVVILSFIYHIPLQDLGIQFLNVITQWNSLSILLSLYFITFLQRMLQARNQIKLVQQDLDYIFHNPVINAIGSSLFIGLLPSPAAMKICGEIVDDVTHDYMDKKDQAFVTSWIRHIPESSLPTYASVLLMASIAGVSMSKFMLGMIIPIIVLLLIGSYPYYRHMPQHQKKQKCQWSYVFSLIKHLWTLIGLLLLILVFHLNIVVSGMIILLIGIIYYHLTFDEVKSMTISAFEKNILLNTYCILVLKECIVYTGMMNTIPELLLKMPLPPFLIFSLIFFFGSIIGGTSGIIAIAGPMALSTIHTGMPLMVLIMCMTHAANQVTPTHLCLVVAADYFDISLMTLMKTTLPKVFIFCIFALLYYLLLIALGIY